MWNTNPDTWVIKGKCHQFRTYSLSTSSFSSSAFGRSFLFPRTNTYKIKHTEHSAKMKQLKCIFCDLFCKPSVTVQWHFGPEMHIINLDLGYFILHTAVCNFNMTSRETEWPCVRWGLGLGDTLWCQSWIAWISLARISGHTFKLIILLCWLQ